MCLFLIWQELKTDLSMCWLNVKKNDLNENKKLSREKSFIFWECIFWQKDSSLWSGSRYLVSGPALDTDKQSISVIWKEILGVTALAACSMIRRFSQELCSASSLLQLKAYFCKETENHSTTNLAGKVSFKFPFYELSQVDIYWVHTWFYSETETERV